MHSAERTTPTPIINPRFTVKRLESGEYELVIYSPTPDIRAQRARQTTAWSSYRVTSRAAHELFEELVGALAQEGRSA